MPPESLSQNTLDVHERLWRVHEGVVTSLFPVPGLFASNFVHPAWVCAKFSTANEAGLVGPSALQSVCTVPYAGRTVVAYGLRCFLILILFLFLFIRNCPPSRHMPILVLYMSRRHSKETWIRIQLCIATTRLCTANAISLVSSSNHLILSSRNASARP